MARVPHADDNGLVCPLHKKPMAEVCHTCPFWTQVRGINPNTGQEVDDWRCAISWLPMLLIENSQQSRSAGAAVESMRNEIVKRMDQQVGRSLEWKQ